jgi:hypothetical protein
MNNTIKREYLLLTTATSSLIVEVLGQNQIIAMTTFKQITYKAEGHTKNETIQKILAMIEEDHLQS